MGEKGQTKDLEERIAELAAEISQLKSLLRAITLDTIEREELERSLRSRGRNLPERN